LLTEVETITVGDLTLSDFRGIMEQTHLAQQLKHK
jgi:hypothetical protein